MKELKEPEIKLFGKKIALPENGKIFPIIPDEDSYGEGSPNEDIYDSDRSVVKKINTCLEDKKLVLEEDEEQKTEKDEDSTDDNPKTPPMDEESGQKTLKKPDKILPCPRCNSMDTKFCYFNNYNTNQPRHFCKSCQRYWTAGGTMRDVPVGAGRRKNKNSAISEALQAAYIDAPNGIHYSTLKPNSTVLSFGSDSPLLNGFSVSCKGGENGNDWFRGSSITTSNSVSERGGNGIHESMMQNIDSFPSQIPCLAAVPWPYPWNSAIPIPPIFPSGFPMPFFPAPGAWSIPWLPPSTNQKAPVPVSNSSTLGKHSRDGDKKSEISSVLVPKTLRIDDPDEAARSSIWATLGIKNDSITRGALFKGFQLKGDEKKHIATTSPALQANPAALSRSRSFQENV